MEASPAVAAGEPRPLLLFLVAIPCTVVSLFAWGLVTLLELIGGYDPAPSILLFVPLLPLPAALVGAVVASRTGRWWPWCVGLVLTLLPAVLAIVLAEPFDPNLGNREFD